MNTIPTGILALAGMITLGIAQAEMKVKPFVKANLGYSIISDIDIDSNGIGLDLEADNSAIYGISVGVNLNKKHDFEIEFASAKYDNDKIVYARFSLPVGGEVKIKTFMLNYRYIFNEKEKLQPYLLGGIGYKDIEGKFSALGVKGSGNTSAFAYQAGLGMKYFVQENIYLDASYRYQGSNDFTIDGDKYKVTNNNFIFGVAYQW